MTGGQFTTVLMSLSLLLVLAHLAGAACARLRQPRFLGEMLVGVLFGPDLLGSVLPDASLLSPTGEPTATALGLMHWLGLAFLMFVSGTHVRRVLARETRRTTLVLFMVGTTAPFLVAVAAGSLIPTAGLLGPRGGTWSILIVLATATAVTSIPVITRIFHELGILQTEFASLVLDIAIVEDVVLWVVTTALTTMASGGDHGMSWELARHTVFNVGFLAAGLLWAPRVLAAVRRAQWRLVERAAPATHAVSVLLLYVAVASALGVNLVLAAFLAGVAFVASAGGDHRARYAPCLAMIENVGFAIFIPMYFVMVGAKLQLGRDLAPGLIVAFLIGSSLVRVTAGMLAGRIIGMRGRDGLNLAITTNARGGPGIVLASIVYDCGLISGGLFTALVVTAVVTSQFAALWLAHVLRRGDPLVSTPGCTPSTAAVRW